MASIFWKFCTRWDDIGCTKELNYACQVSANTPGKVALAPHIWPCCSNSPGKVKFGPLRMIMWTLLVKLIQFLINDHHTARAGKVWKSADLVQCHDRCPHLIWSSLLNPLESVTKSWIKLASFLNSNFNPISSLWVWMDHDWGHVLQNHLRGGWQ